MGNMPMGILVSGGRRHAESIGKRKEDIKAKPERKIKKAT